MRGNDNVKTAIRWRPITANRNVAVEKIGENVSHQKITQINRN